MTSSISLPKYSPVHPCAIYLATPACATPHAALRNGATWQKWQGSPQSAARSLNLGNQRDKNINSVTQWGAWCLLRMVKSWPWWFWNNIICDSYHGSWPRSYLHTFLVSWLLQTGAVIISQFVNDDVSYIQQIFSKKKQFISHVQSYNPPQSLELKWPQPQLEVAPHVKNPKQKNGILVPRWKTITLGEGFPASWLGIILVKRSLLLLRLQAAMGGLHL